MTKSVVFDIDGVLADFMSNFSEVGNHLFGTPLQSHGTRSDWSMEDIYTPEQVALIWENMDWFNCDPLIPFSEIEMMKTLATVYKIVYCTNRYEDAFEETCSWLEMYEFPEGSLIFTDNKAEALKSENNKLVAIEDRAGNVLEMRRSGLLTVVRDWPYNRSVDGPRVGSVGEFIKEILNGSYSNQ